MKKIDEDRGIFLNCIRGIIDECANMNKSPRDTSRITAFSILVALDGGAIECGPYAVRPFNENGEEGEDIAGSLHHSLHNILGKENKMPNKKSAFTNPKWEDKKQVAKGLKKLEDISLQVSKKDDIAPSIVDKMILDIENSDGFKDGWEQIDPKIKNKIRSTWRNLIKEILINENKV